MLAALLLLPLIAFAQELEPRRYNNTATNINIVSVGYAWSNGNVLLDPALPIEDLDADLHLVFAKYTRTFAFFGSNAKFRFLLPATTGRWTGTVDGESGKRRDQGIGDAWMTFEWNFLGAPALDLQGMKTYQAGWVAGTSVLVTVPVGSYDSDKLLNLGSNRWSARAELAAAYTHENWTWELIGGVRAFTDNDNFFGGNTLSQDPLWIAKGAMVYSFDRPGVWLAAALGWGVGGRTAINDVEKDTRQKNLRLGLTFAYAIARRHGVAFSYVTGVARGSGSDFDTLAMSYNYAWGGGL